MPASEIVVLQENKMQCGVLWMAAVLCYRHLLMAAVCLAWFSVVSAFTPVIRWLKQNESFSLSETRKFLIDFPDMPTVLEEFPLRNNWPFPHD